MFKKATKAQSKLRCAIFGPSGAGKTFTALRMAKGIGGKIAVIDTERGSASKYSDRFAFDVCDLDDRSIDGYIRTMQMAAQAGYEILIIDSMSHGWQELLQEVNQLANAKYRGNTWSAWSEGTPKQKKLIDALLDFPGHIIATMRSKTEWNVGSTASGGTRPVRVGLAPEQGKGIEYEFDLLLELSTEHVANCLKDRTGKFQDKIIEKPGEEFGRELAAWLSEGEPPDERATYAPADLPTVAAPTATDLSRLKQLISERGIASDRVVTWCEHFNVIGLKDLSQEQVDAIVEKLEAQPVQTTEPGAAPDATVLNALIEKHNIPDMRVMDWCVHFKVGCIDEMTQVQVDALVERVKEKYETATAN